MSLSLRAPAVGLSAAAVREGERAGQSVWRNFQTTKQSVLALAQAGGGITFGIVPVHLGVVLHQECAMSRPFFCWGNLRKAASQELQSVPGLTGMGRNSWLWGWSGSRSRHGSAI